MSLDVRYNELRLWLKSSLVRVEFITKDGTPRIMYCTIDPNIVESNLQDDFNYVDNDSVFTVWDVDNGHWRSFKPANVKTYRKVESVPSS